MTNPQPNYVLRRTSTPENEDLPVRYNKAFGEVLQKKGISLVVTLLNAGKVLVVSGHERIPGRLLLSTLNMARPMGFAISQDETQLALAQHDGIVFYQLHDAATQGENDYDAVYVPLHLHVTGYVDAHDMEFTGKHDNSVIFANTAYSLIASTSPGSDESFAIEAVPSYVEAIDYTDRIHLNGLAYHSQAYRPTHVTCLTAVDNGEEDWWKQENMMNGVLWNLAHQKPALSDLCMPHSPRWHGKLYFLESGYGTLNRVSLRMHPMSYPYAHNKPLASFPGLTRGLDFHESLAFVGLSRERPRRNEEDAPLQIPVFDEPVKAGVAIYDIEADKHLGMMELSTGMDEVFSVKVLKKKRPVIAQWGSRLSRFSHRIGDNR